MERRLYVSYLIVNAKGQAESESCLSLSVQRDAIAQYLNGGKHEVLREYEEAESWKNRERPELQKALSYCQRTGATLLVPKLDRLGRNIHFTISLEKAGVDFVVCDFPEANKSTIHIFAALAQYERELISQRTKAALARSTKPKGVKGPDNLRGAADAGRKKGRAAALAKANNFAAKVGPMVQAYQKEGLSLTNIAAKLNEDRVQTARGKYGAWTATAVKNLLTRKAKADAFDAPLGTPVFGQKYGQPNKE